MLSQVITPEIQGLFNRSCFNYKGKIRVQQSYPGVTSSVLSTVPQKFEKIFCKTLTDLADARFNHFVHEVLLSTF